MGCDMVAGALRGSRGATVAATALPCWADCRTQSLNQLTDCSAWGVGYLLEGSGGISQRHKHTYKHTQSCAYVLEPLGGRVFLSSSR